MSARDEAGMEGNLTSLASLRERFASPPFGYAPFHFWMWNGDMRPAEIARQIAGMHANGIEQFMICPTAGLELEYLGDAFLERVAFACATAEALGMRAWLYDELNWPSGPVGGALLAAHPEYRMRFLACYRRDVPDASDGSEVLLHFEDGDVILAVARTDDGREIDLSAQLEGFAREVVREDSTYIGNRRPVDVAYRHGSLRVPAGEWRLRVAVSLPTRVLLSAELGTRWSPEVVGYIDTLNTEAVAEFIHLTHERYATAVGRYFGGIVPGIFTDEPTIDRPHRVVVSEGWHCDALPWSHALAPRFEAEAGYSLQSSLKAMLFGEATAERSRFWRAVTAQYVESYHAQIRRWCHAHSLRYVGHVLGDDLPNGWVDCSGDLHRVLGELDVPGFDEVGPFPSLFGEDDRHPISIAPPPASYLGLRSLTGGKLASSVAHQGGDGDCLVEALALQGFRPGLADARAACSWMLALGANRLLVASMFYTQKATRKTTEPSLHDYHSPFWPYYRHFAVYTGRLAFALSQGVHVAPVAMIVPEAALQSPAGHEVAEAGLVALATALFGRHVDFDFVSEEQALAALAGAGDSGRLRLGRESFSAVVVPPGAARDPALAEALAAFARRDGVVLSLPSVGPPADEPLPPGQVLRATAAEALADECEAALGRFRPARIVDAATGREAAGVVCLCRALGDGLLLFVANLSREDRRLLVQPAVACAGFEVWDPETGTIARPAVDGGDGEPAAVVDLAPGEGKLLALLAPGCGQRSGPGCFRPAERRRIDLAGDWRFWAQRPNVYPLNDWAVAAGPDGPWQPVSHGVAALEEAALRGRPWVRARFHLTHSPGDLSLVTERGVVLELRLNGRPLAGEPEDGGGFDECSQRRDIAGQVLAGDNEIVAHLDVPAKEWHSWYGRPTLGSAYLSGDFAVVDGNLVPQPSAVLAGSWAEQGYPYYSGAATYERDVDLSTGDLDGGLWLGAQVWGGVLEVAVNGQTLAVRPWPPYGVDVSAAVRPGPNRLALTVTNTIANRMGDVIASGLAGAWLEAEVRQP